MNKYFNILVLLLISLLVAQCKSHNEAVSTHYFKIWDKETAQDIEKRVERLSCSGNAYNLMSLRAYLGANNVVLKEQNDKGVIEYQVSIIENLINSAEESRDIENNKSPYNDEFMGWTSKRDNSTYNLEVPLYESYAFFYIAQFLYLSHTTDWYKNSKQNQRRWETMLSFVETHVWTKWYERSNPVKGNHYWYFLRGRTHMGSHWAGIAMYLNQLTHNEQIKEQTKSLIQQYDTLLKRNLKPAGRAYVWNATYDDVTNTDASKAKENIIQDGSHGNHVVSYIIAAYELRNPNWTLKDVNRLAYTLVDLMYDETTNSFYDNVDGSNHKNRPGWGNFVGDGWVKLATYNEEAKKVLLQFNENTNKLGKYNQEVQFKSSLLPLLNNE